MLSKQSIRKGMVIKCNNIKLTKDEIIDISKKWSERQETLFRLMLRTGGDLTIKGDKFEIKIPESMYNSKGEIESALYENEED